MNLLRASLVEGPMLRRLFFGLAASALAVACGSSSVGDLGSLDAGGDDSDASSSDGALGDDAASADGGSKDSGSDTSHDAGSGDATSDAAPHDTGADGPDAAGQVILNFDDKADGTLTPGYGGLTWDADWYVYNTVAGEYEAHSGTQFITNLSQTGSISFSFPQPVYFSGAWFSLKASRNAHVQLVAYDASNTVVGSSPTIVQDLVPAFLSVGVGNVKKVSVVFDVDFAMDDVTYIP